MRSLLIQSTGKILFDLYRKGFTKEFDLGLYGQLIDRDMKAYKPEDIRITEQYLVSKSQNEAPEDEIYGVETSTGIKGVLFNRAGSVNYQRLPDFKRMYRFRI